MRIAVDVTSLSWIPSEAVTGVIKAGFASGLTHYDQPPPDTLGDLDALREADRFRFANRLAAWVEVDDDGQRHRRRPGRRRADGRRPRCGSARSAPPSPRSRCRTCAADPRSGRLGAVRQTAGGRTALPLPRPVRRPPFVQLQAPLVWTTLALTLHADGRSEVRADRGQPVPAALGVRRRR